MYLLEVTGEDAIELMADLFDPIAEIASDVKFMKCIQTGQRAKAVKVAMKDHKKSIIQILAICNNIPEDEYKRTAPEMLRELFQVINHPIVSELFFSQAQNMEEPNSGSATENTEGQE